MAARINQGNIVVAYSLSSPSTVSRVNQGAVVAALRLYKISEVTERMTSVKPLNGPYPAAPGFTE